MELKDQIGNLIKLDVFPKRIVSLVPSQTELLYDLGLEASIVGITKFCVHPNHLLKTKTIVGGTKQIKLEKIKALQPDIILCNKEENTKEIVETCKTICIVHVSDIENISDCIEMITQYGELFNVKNEALIITSTIKSNQKEFKNFIALKPTLKAAYFIWKDPWMVAGNQTFINYMLALNNLKNVFANITRYPEVDIDNLPKNLDLILLSSEPFPFKKEHVALLQKQYPKVKVIIVDGEYFSWYGSRVQTAFNYFKNLRLSL